MKINLLLLAFVIAAFILISNVEAYKLNETIDFKKSCANNGTYCSGSATCNLTITNPSERLVVNNNLMTNKVSYHNKTIPGDLVNETGTYSYIMTCADGGLNGFIEDTFEVTRNGEPMASEGLRIFIYILFVISLVGIFITCILTLAKLATTSETIFGVMFTIAMYLLLVLTYVLASNYLALGMIENISLTLIKISGVTNVFLPIISLIITFFVKSTQKQSVPSVQEFTGGGFRYG